MYVTTNTILMYVKPMNTGNKFPKTAPNCYCRHQICQHTAESYCFLTYTCIHLIWYSILHHSMPLPTLNTPALAKSSLADMSS